MSEPNVLRFSLIPLLFSISLRDVRRFIPFLSLHHCSTYLKLIVLLSFFRFPFLLMLLYLLLSFQILQLAHVFLVVWYSEIQYLKTAVVVQPSPYELIRKVLLLGLPCCNLFFFKYVYVCLSICFSSILSSEALYISL